MPNPKPAQVAKSCLNCPSMMNPAETHTFFKKTIGTPTCAVFGKPLATITSTESETKAIMKSAAQNCSEFGKPRPTVPDWDKAVFNVAIPAQMLDQKDDKKDLVTTCKMCEFFIPEDITLEERGFAAGLCAQKGKLILGTRQTFEARACEVKSFGTPDAGWISNLFFLPEYEPGFLGAADPKLVREKNKKHLIDPNDYETDAEVSDEDSARGIRAWRQIDDADTGRYVLLPIYRNDFFDEDERSKIPSIGDDEHPEDYIDHFGGTYKLAALWIQLNETPAVWGEAGTGKTELFRHMAWLMQLPFYRFSITGSTELDDLAGKMHLGVNSDGVNYTYFKYGRLPIAWSKPCVMVIDEPNTGPNEVWQFLRPLTDNSKQLVLDMNEGERINRHQDCYLGMAMNPAWDMRNVGANQIGDADANRMMHMALDLPPEVIEREIIKARCAHDGYEIPEETLTMIMRIGKDIRALCEDQTLTMSWAIRPQIKVARALAWFDPLTAYKMASADYLEPAQAKLVMAAVKAHVE